MIAAGPASRRTQHIGAICVSQPAARGKRCRMAASNHEMIEHPAPNAAQNLFELGGDALIGHARFRDTAWVIVSEDRCRRIVLQSRSDDFPGMDGASVDRAVEKFLSADHTLSLVEPHDVELLVLEACQSHPQVVATRAWVGERHASLVASSEDVLGSLQHLGFSDAQVCAGVAALASAIEAHVVVSHRHGMRR